MSPWRTNPPELWPGLFEDMPHELAACLTQPAFEIGATTFCIWRCYSDPKWQHGPVQFPTIDSDPDGSEYLLSALDGNPETYRRLAARYFTRADLSLTSVQRVFAHETPSEDLVQAVNPQRVLNDLMPELLEIGYPSVVPGDIA
jgi:hypothetical protein